MDSTRLHNLIKSLDYAPAERQRLVRLMCVLGDLASPPDPLGLFPRYESLHHRFLGACRGTEAEALEEAFLELYCHLHGHEAPYTREERRRVDQVGGYWCHAGGLSPILKAGRYLSPETVSGDFGAGNGLQGLLMQKLDPHALTIQIEISSRMVEAGQHLQRWLGIARERVEWRVADVMDVSCAEMDFIYLYRPVRPVGVGRKFYQRLAAELGGLHKPVVIFSIADCLQTFLPDGFEVFYSDGHLTCIRKQ